MVLQYNAVYGRANGEAQLNNVNWPQYVSSIVPPKGDELAKGTYRPLLAPVNFTKFAKSSTFFTVWYAGPLSIQKQPRAVTDNPEQSADVQGSKGSGREVDPGRVPGMRSGSSRRIEMAWEGKTVFRYLSANQRSGEKRQPLLE
jgi:hypothetical protein